MSVYTNDCDMRPKKLHNGQQSAICIRRNASGTMAKIIV